MTFFYAQTSSPPPVNSISVSSSLLTGSTIEGVQVDLRVNGSTIKSGYTPVTFTGLHPGIQYQVVVYWLDSYYFRKFSDGNLNRYATVTLNGTKYASLNAQFEQVPATQAAQLNVIAEFPNGTLIGTSLTVNQTYQHTPGMWVQIVPPGQTAAYTGSFTGGSILPFVLFNHETYTVEMSGVYGNIQFSHWQDNQSNINPTRTVTLNGDTTLTAIYVQK